MIVRRFYDDKLAQASWLVGCGASGEALVVDPNRDIDQYLRAAEEEGVRITHVTETHIHADFVSGSRELASRTGAQLYLSGEGGPDWSYGYAEAAGAVLVRDGDTFNVGNVSIRVMHTPGHTPEHIVFIVTDGAAADLPMGLLTGDFVFVGDGGGPVRDGETCEVGTVAVRVMLTPGHTPDHIVFIVSDGAAADLPLGVLTGDFVFVGDVGRPDLRERAAGFAGTMEAGARDLYR